MMDKSPDSKFMSKFEDVGIDNWELFIDNMFDNNIVREIPVLKNIVSLYKGAKSIKDYLLVNKINKFLNSIEDISKSEVEKMIEQIGDERKLKDFGMRILQMIEALDDTRKASLIGKLFVYYIRGKIDINEFNRIGFIINKCYYEDIIELKHFTKSKIITSQNNYVSHEVLENLFSYGLLREQGFDGGDFSGGNAGTCYTLNRYSEILILIVD